MHVAQENVGRELIKKKWQRCLEERMYETEGKEKRGEKAMGMQKRMKEAKKWKIDKPMKI